MGTRKPKGYWSNWDNIIKELNPIIKKLGRFPSQKDLTDLDRRDILNGLSRNQGGLSRVKKEMGYETSQKQGGYWQDWENFEAEMKKVIDEVGHFPTQSKLREIGRYDLLKGARHHGSYVDLRKRFGFKAEQHPPNYWKDYANLKSKLTEIIEQIGHFPSQRELSDLGYSTLSVVMRKYHGGVDKIREKLGFENTRTPYHYYKDWDNVKSQLLECIDEEGDLPSPNELIKIGKGNLVRGVYTYHGGFQNVREKLGLEKSKLTFDDFYEDPDKVKEKLEEVELELGRFPTTRDLKKYSSKFYDAICRHFGGLQNLRHNYYDLEDFLEDYLGGSENGNP